MFQRCQRFNHKIEALNSEQLRICNSSHNFYILYVYVMTMQGLKFQIHNWPVLSGGLFHCIWLYQMHLLSSTMPYFNLRLPSPATIQIHRTQIHKSMKVLKKKKFRGEKYLREKTVKAEYDEQNLVGKLFIL